MVEPGSLSRHVLAGLWLAVGIAMIIVPVWLVWSRWQPLLNGHPTLPGLALGSLVIGVVAVGWAIGSLFFTRRLEAPNPRLRRRRLTADQRRRRATGRIVVSVPLLIICLVVVLALGWARPLPAGARALAAMQNSSAAPVRVVDKLTWYELVPNRRDKVGNLITPTIGLAFFPGARVDPRGYAAQLRPLAEAGYLVAVLKEPFGVALAGPDQATTVLKVHPEIDYWAVGGHSLGGVAAARYAQEHPAGVSGLVLLAAYPSARIDRTDLKIASISGSADRITTPAEVEQNKVKLPPQTGYQMIDGATHSTFGDYGEQRGDGTATVDRDAAQAEIAKSIGALLASLPPKKK